jgi:hypothetical protein
MSKELYFVVSDVWMGCGEVWAESAEDAARCQYNQILNCKLLEDDADEEEIYDMVRLEQFRAWPYRNWPHHLSFDEAFYWIGEQRATEGPTR